MSHPSLRLSRTCWFLNAEATGFHDVVITVYVDIDILRLLDIYCFALLRSRDASPVAIVPRRLCFGHG